MSEGADSEPFLGGFDASGWASCPTARALRGTDFARGFFEPASRPTFDARIGVAFCPFRWDESDAWTWLLCSVGLASLTQVRPADPIAKPVAKISPHIELCAAFREPPSPAWAAFRRAWEANALGHHDAVPTMISRFGMIAHEFASWIVRDRDAFAIGDHVENASLAAGFPSSLLAPPIPQLLLAGCQPFDARGVPAKLPIGKWAERDVLHAAGDHLFVQLVPLTAEEYRAARWDGFRFFLSALLASDEEMASGMDAAHHIVDLTRRSRQSPG